MHSVDLKCQSRGAAAMLSETLTRMTKPKKGLKVNPRYTRPGSDPFSAIEWERRTSLITNPDGSIVFKMDNARVPKGWSQVAVDIIAQKYFRRAGVPAALKKVQEPGIPEWIQRSVADEVALSKMAENKRMGGETDAA